MVDGLNFISLDAETIFDNLPPDIGFDVGLLDVTSDAYLKYMDALATAETIALNTTGLDEHLVDVMIEKAADFATTLRDCAKEYRAWNQGDATSVRGLEVSGRTFAAAATVFSRSMEAAADGMEGGSSNAPGKAKYLRDLAPFNYMMAKSVAARIEAAARGMTGNENRNVAESILRTMHQPDPSVPDGGMPRLPDPPDGQNDTSDAPTLSADREGSGSEATQGNELGDRSGDTGERGGEAGHGEHGR